MHSKFHPATLAFGAMLLVPAVARAGCPNMCEMTSEPGTIDPPLPCITAETSGDNCNCGMWLNLINDCDEPITPTDFVLRGCYAGKMSYTSPCPIVEPGHRGTIFWGIDTLGETRKVVTIQAADGEHRIELVANVASFDDGCACSLPGQPSSSGFAGIGALILAVSIGASRKERRAAQRRASRR